MADFLGYLLKIPAQVSALGGMWQAKALVTPLSLLPPNVFLWLQQKEGTSSSPCLQQQCSIWPAFATSSLFYTHSNNFATKARNQHLILNKSFNPFHSWQAARVYPKVCQLRVQEAVVMTLLHLDSKTLSHETQRKGARQRAAEWAICLLAPLLIQRLCAYLEESHPFYLSLSIYNKEQQGAFGVSPSGVEEAHVTLWTHMNSFSAVSYLVLLQSKKRCYTGRHFRCV